MVVAHNVLAMNANRMLGINTKTKAKSTEKLSSGYKINRAADDAAGLAISEKMRRQIRGLSQGIENTQDGVSLCQVADGALSEVSDMLHRLEELSVKSANGTNSSEDRKYIQEEVNQILDEINRIGDTTEFNEVPIFKGGEEILFNSDGSIGSWKDVSYDDIKFGDVTVCGPPFMPNSPANYLNFCATIDKPGHALDATTIDAIYGRGSTSTTAARITYKDDNGNEVKRNIDLSQLQPSDYTFNGSTYQKYYDYSDGTISIRFREYSHALSGSKGYFLGYDVENHSSREITYDLMFHLDTAYNNNDLCEEYYVDGKKITQSDVYQLRDSPGQSTCNPFYGDPGIKLNPSAKSISIINSQDALPYSEKITFRVPEGVLSIGNYYRIKDWDYYDNISKNTGRSTQSEDLGIAYIIRDKVAAYDPLTDPKPDSSMAFWMNFTLEDARKDSNLNGVPITFNQSVATKHISESDIWIQSGNEAGDGIHLRIGEMNTAVLGIGEFSVLTTNDAEKSISKLKGALSSVSENRSKIGAQQNRLEHTIRNESNIVENTTAAESQIRDTDMAKEMVAFSNLNVLQQAGQSMLAQANQSKQGILSLLQ